MTERALATPQKVADITHSVASDHVLQRACACGCDWIAREINRRDCGIGIAVQDIGEETEVSGACGRRVYGCGKRIRLALLVRFVDTVEKRPVTLHRPAEANAVVVLHEDVARRDW